MLDSQREKKKKKKEMEQWIEINGAFLGSNQRRDDFEIVGDSISFRAYRYHRDGALYRSVS